MVVCADEHAEGSGNASRPETEVARPEVKSSSVEKPSFGSVAAVGGRSQLVVEESETGIEPRRVIHFRPDRNRK